MQKSLTEKLLTWDTHAFKTIESREKPGLRRNIWRFLSHTADGPWYFLAALAVGAFHWGGTFNAFLMAAAIGFGLEMPIYRMLKRSLKRQRPFRKLTGVVNYIHPPDEFSFPSGHAAGAFLMATIFVFCMPSYAFPAYLWAGAVGYSRVALGVHYPGDVLAGSALGMACALAGLLVGGMA